MATHSSTLAWKTPWMEDLVGYSPWGRIEAETEEGFNIMEGCPLSCWEEGKGRNPFKVLLSPPSVASLLCCIFSNYA